MLLVGLMACNPALEVPTSARVRCADDADCPSERCSATVGICIAKDDDDSPLRIASVEALDARHVVVLFNREVDPVSAADFTVYALSPGLSPEAAVVSDDRLSVTVQTTQQKLRTYLLDVVDVVDPIGRPLERTQKQFTGIGDQVSGQSPTPLSPLDHSLFTDPGITLTWGALPDAVDYSVEVVRLTAGGEVPVDGSPFVTRDTELSLTVEQDATYSWRVSADTSREPPVASSFVVFGDAVHAYCPATADCNVADSWDAGTPGNPSRRIGRALALAALLSRGEVRIAGRGGGAVYDEAFLVVAPITRVAGGYDPSFSVVDPAATPTVVRGDPTAVRVVSTGSVELVDLELQSSGGATLVLTGVADLTATRLTLLSIEEGRPLDVRRCTPGKPVTFSYLRTAGVVGLGDVARVRVAGGCDVTFDHSAIGGAGLEVARATARLTDSSVVASLGPRSVSQDFQGIEVAALVVDGGTLTLDRVFVRAGVVDAYAENHVALLALAGATVQVDASTLVASRVGYADCYPENCQGSAFAVSASLPAGFSDISIVVTNSVLAASAPSSAVDGTAATVVWGGPGTMSLVHDIFYVEDGTALYINSSQSYSNDLEVLDSALVCSGNSVGGDAVTDVPPRLLRATAFVGCTVPYRRLGTVYTAADTIETIGDPAPHTFTNLHVFPSPIAETFPQYGGPDGQPGTPDDDWSCGTACSSLGESSLDPICGDDGFNDCLATVDVDSTGAARTVPVSIGPREVD